MTCSQKEQAQKGRQDGTSIAKAKPTHRASSTTSWSYAYPSYKKHSTRNKSWIRNQLTRCLYTSLSTFLLGIAGLQRLDRHETSPSKEGRQRLRLETPCVRHVCVPSCVRLFVTLWTVALRPWNFPGKNTRVGFHFLLQGIFPTQGSNLCLLH